MACVDSNPDSQLTVDSSTTVQDGPSPAWWMSPDIEVNGGTDTIKVGSNTVRVRVRRAAGLEFPAGTANIAVEVWFADPGLAFFPNNGATQIGTGVVSITDPDIAAGVPKWVAVACTVPSVTLRPGEPADGPWHRCLVARGYPDVLTPESTCFHVTGDQHVAQRNITVVKAPGGQLRASFQTYTPDGGRRSPGTVRVEADTRPTRLVMGQIGPVLDTIANFRRVSTRVPSAFEVRPIERIRPELGPVVGLERTTIRPDERLLTPIELPGMQLRDRTRALPLYELRSLFGLAGPLRYDVAATLDAGRGADFVLEADLRRTAPGEVTVFHATHRDEKDRVVGGLTILAVRA